MVPIMEPFFTLLISLILSRKSVVSFICDLWMDASGCRKMSAKADIFSVAQPFEEAIRPPIFCLVPCAFWLKKTCTVRASFVLMWAIRLQISPKSATM